MSTSPTTDPIPIKSPEPITESLDGREVVRALHKRTASGTRNTLEPGYSRVGILYLGSYFKSQTKFLLIFLSRRRGMAVVRV
jgi:hypothetical protein